MINDVTVPHDYLRGYADALASVAKLLTETNASLLLHMGEMTAQETRSVQAALAWKARQVEALRANVNLTR